MTSEYTRGESRGSESNEQEVVLSVNQADHHYVVHAQFKAKVLKVYRTECKDQEKSQSVLYHHTE